jgi:hypothetical protein
MADHALYDAKHSGRDRVNIAGKALNTLQGKTIAALIDDSSQS